MSRESKGYLQSQIQGLEAERYSSMLRGYFVNKFLSDTARIFTVDAVKEIAKAVAFIEFAPGGGG